MSEQFSQCSASACGHFTLAEIIVNKHIPHYDAGSVWEKKKKKKEKGIQWYAKGRVLWARHKYFPCANSTSLNIINNAFTWSRHNNEFRKCCVCVVQINIAWQPFIGGNVQRAESYLEVRNETNLLFDSARTFPQKEKISGAEGQIAYVNRGDIDHS